ncbi:uncharacterized protein LOC124252681 isoform X1 [Haliotis rubra]|uniref:uncharacterized protein LOC124252681 isoform X1 n=1 Tax=Haliotis rubra TaxID=36100 RepID=UPI001EE5098B|nr:uncharacterized protein LOC124252681 isoform X1 [Haliotis rubra]
MPTEEELRAGHSRTKKEYALPGEDGTLSNQKRQARQVQEEGETHTAYEGDVVVGEKDIQNTNSFHPRFKPVLIGINIDDTSDRRQYELVPRKEIYPSVKQFLEEIENEKSSPPAKEETLRIFQKIVTHPESVCSVFHVNSVTYVFILVECSPEDGSFAASVQGHDKVLALIYDATNKRFVLVLFGDIKDSIEWKQKYNQQFITLYSLSMDEDTSQQ